MRSIDLTVLAGSQAGTAFKAIKRFDASAMLGPTLALLRAAQPLHIDMVNCLDRLACFSGLLRLLDELDGLQVPYEIQIADRIEEGDDGGPVWLPRPGTKSDIVASLEDERKRKANRETAAESRMAYQPAEHPDRLTLLNGMLHERWQRHGFQGLLPQERDFVLFRELHAEVSNGTFDQYLCNSSGDHALETVDALRRSGLKIVLDIVLRVLDVLPGGWCAERDERIRRIASMPNRFAMFRSLTDGYYEAIETEAGNNRLIENLEIAYVHAGLLPEAG